MNLSRFGIMPIIGLYIVFSLSFIVGKVGMVYAPPIFFSSVRALISGIVLLGYSRFYLRENLKIFRSDISLFMQVAFFGEFITNITMFWALQYMFAAKVAFFYLFTPFFTAFICWVYGLEQFSIKKIIGLFIGLFGLIPFFVSQLRSEGEFAGYASFFSFTLPEIATIFSVACYAYGWIVIKQLVQTQRYSPWLINGIVMTSGGLASAGTSFFVDAWYKAGFPVSSWIPFMWWLLLMSAVGIFSYVFYSYLLKFYSATMISFFGFTEPFFAVFYGWLILSESVTWFFFVSLIIVSVGLYLFYQEELQLR